jgi:hypothetical protein
MAGEPLSPREYHRRREEERLREREELRQRTLSAAEAAVLHSAPAARPASRSKVKILRISSLLLV